MVHNHYFILRLISRNYFGYNNKNKEEVIMYITLKRHILCVLYYQINTTFDLCLIIHNLCNSILQILDMRRRQLSWI